jgi:hypothetical protein
MIPMIITTVERNPADLSARAHAECARGAWQAVGEYWQREILPPRFRPGASYPHKHRSPAWLKRKRAMAERGALIGGRPILFGGNVTNVLTGNMAELVTRPGVVTGFPTRGSVRKVGPRYVTMRPFQSNQPDKWAELTFVNQGDRAALGQVWMATYARLRDARNETRTSTMA